MCNLMYVRTYLISIDKIVMISLEQSQYLRTNENSSPLSLSITKSDDTTIDVVVEVTITDGTAIG